jgi:hypothetical protein
VGFGEFFADYAGEEGQVGLLVGGGKGDNDFSCGYYGIKRGECAV